MGYGDNLATWLGRFGSGVTLAAFNVNGGAANFATKDLSFSQGATNYKYGGIGVSASGGRDAETDFISPTKTERIEATFATPLTKATIGVGGLFGGSGAPFDSPYTEQLVWKAYNAGGALIGQGLVVGTQNGLVEFNVEISGQSIKKIVLTPGDNSPGLDVGSKESDFLLRYIDGGAQDSAKEAFTYKLEDANGDQSSANFTITVNDHVTAANQAPTSTNDSVTTNEDTALTLGIGDFGTYSDIEGTAIAAVKITALESDGSLEYDTTGLWQLGSSDA